MPTLHLIQLEDYPILLQLQLEEALLRTDDRNWCILNSGSPPAVVLGISGDPQLLINFEQLKSNPIPMIKRFSGGGTVVVDEETLFVTFIINSSDVNIGCCPKTVLHWSAQYYEPLFPENNFQVQENDYALGDRKFGGNAQYFRKERWLHHTTLLWDYNPARMRTLKLPPKRPEYRADRNHEDFLCRLRDMYPVKKEFFDKFLEGLTKQFSIKEVSLGELERVCERPHRKSTQVI